ncbi:MAG: tetrahydrofolate dehydrogenase/cyclohydrolase catalytic domain-containing protein [Phycisphaeraceae bacterium]
MEAKADGPVILRGKPVADMILERCRARIGRIKKEAGVTPCLVTVLTGNDPASEKYVDRKGKLCHELGMESIKIKFPASTTTEQLVTKVKELASDPKIHGILLQHPMPRQIDERVAFEAVGAAKDVDGVTFHSFGTMTFGLRGFDSATPGGIIRLMRHYEVEIEGKHAVVIGRSVILGRPMGMLLLQANATVTITHSRTEGLADHVRRADIVVAAVGKPNFVKGDWIKPGAVVIDAGFNPGPTGNVGDVDYEACLAKSSMITPVPGGVGPMTLAVLMEQTVTGAARQAGLGDLDDQVVSVERAGDYSPAFVQSVWAKARAIAGKDPKLVRMDAFGRVIEREAYGDEAHPNGWMITHTGDRSNRAQHQAATCRPMHMRNVAAKAPL